MVETMNSLVVAIYARAAMDREETGVSDLSVAASKIKNNIVQGLPLDPVGGIPLKYVPDWDGWHQAYETIGNDKFAEEWVGMDDLRRKLWEPLYQLWDMKNYDGMVEIMDNPPTPAAIKNWPNHWDGVRPARSEEGWVDPEEEEEKPADTKVKE